jgi:hypothetical protein
LFASILFLRARPEGNPAQSSGERRNFGCYTLKANYFSGDRPSARKVFLPSAINDSTIMEKYERRTSKTTALEPY